MSELTDQIRDLCDRADKYRGDYNSAQLVWGILSALRGPDSNKYDLKYITTERIRGIVTPSSKSVGMLTREYPISQKEKEARSELLEECNHFSSHYWLAVRAIKELYHYDLENECEVSDGNS